MKSGRYISPIFSIQQLDDCECLIVVARMDLLNCTDPDLDAEAEEHLLFTWISRILWLIKNKVSDLIEVLQSEDEDYWLQVWIAMSSLSASFDSHIGIQGRVNDRLHHSLFASVISPLLDLCVWHCAASVQIDGSCVSSKAFPCIIVHCLINRSSLWVVHSLFLRISKNTSENHGPSSKVLEFIVRLPLLVYLVEVIIKRRFE